MAVLPYEYSGGGGVSSTLTRLEHGAAVALQGVDPNGRSSGATSSIRPFRPLLSMLRFWQRAGSSVQLSLRRFLRNLRNLALFLRGQEGRSFLAPVFIATAVALWYLFPRVLRPLLHRLFLRRGRRKVARGGGPITLKFLEDQLGEEPSLAEDDIASCAAVMEAAARNFGRIYDMRWAQSNSKLVFRYFQEHNYGTLCSVRVVPTVSAYCVRVTWIVTLDTRGTSPREKKLYFANAFNKGYLYSSACVDQDGDFVLDTTSFFLFGTPRTQALRQAAKVLRIHDMNMASLVRLWADLRDTSLPFATHTMIDEHTVSSVAEAKVDSVDGENMCIICWEPIREGDKIRRLNCMHAFHKDEIDRHLVENKQCPICKSPIDRKWPDTECKNNTNEESCGLQEVFPGIGDARTQPFQVAEHADGRSFLLGDDGFEEAAVVEQQAQANDDEGPFARRRPPPSRGEDLEAEAPERWFARRRRPLRGRGIGVTVVQNLESLGISSI